MLQIVGRLWMYIPGGNTTLGFTNPDFSIVRLEAWGTVCHALALQESKLCHEAFVFI